MSIKSIDLKFTSIYGRPFKKEIVTREEWEPVKTAMEDMAFWLRQVAIETVSQETEDGIYGALARYKEAKQ